MNVEIMEHDNGDKQMKRLQAYTERIKHTREKKEKKKGGGRA